MQRKTFFIVLFTGIVLIFGLIQYWNRTEEVSKSWRLPLSGKVIYLDPGHGGPDGGAGDKDALEKDLALNISLKLRDFLQEQGALVIMTREIDKDLASPETKGYRKRKREDLKTRLKLINSSEADLFLSIHLNSIPSPKWSGAQTFFTPHFEENERIAKFIQDEFISSLGNTTRKAKIINNVYILKHAKKPGALVEVGFLSNPEERRNLITSAYQEKIAVSIYKGISRYFTNEETPN